MILRLFGEEGLFLLVWSWIVVLGVGWFRSVIFGEKG